MNFPGPRFLFLRILLMEAMMSLTNSSRIVDNRGKKFFMTFIKNYGDKTQHMLMVTSEYDAIIHVNNPSASFSSDRQRQYSIHSGGSLQISLGEYAAVMTNRVVEKKAVLLEASESVAVFGFSLEYRRVLTMCRSSDGYLALPTELLGTNYIISTYSSSVSESVQVVIAATENDTDVTLTLICKNTTKCGNTAVTSGYKFQFLLHAQEVVRVSCDTDLTGSTLASNKPVAIVSGVTCTNVPPTRPFCDHLMEMLVPVTGLGTKYLLHTFSGRDDGAIYRIVRSQNDTVVKYDGVQSPKTSGFDELTLTQGQTIVVTSDIPVLVVGFALGQEINTAANPGDPFMTLLPFPDLAPSTFILDLNITSAGRTFTTYVTIVVKSEFADGVMVGTDAMEMDAVNGGMAIGSTVLDGNWPVKIYHKNSSVAMSVVAYGFLNGEAFAFPAGFALETFSETTAATSTGSTTVYLPTSKLRTNSSVISMTTNEFTSMASQSTTNTAIATTKSFLTITGPNTSLMTTNSSVFPRTTTKSFLTITGPNTSLMTTNSSVFPMTTTKSFLTITGPNTSLMTTNSSVFPMTTTNSSLTITKPNTSLMTTNSSVFPMTTTKSFLTITGPNTSLMTTNSSVFPRTTTKSFLTTTGPNTSLMTTNSSVFPMTTTKLFLLVNESGALSKATKVSELTPTQTFPTSKAVTRHLTARCPCSCSYLQQLTESQRQNLSLLLLAEKRALQIRAELAVESKTTAKAQQRLISLSDSRTSAASLGLISVGFLVFFIVLLIIQDVVSLIGYILKRQQQKTSRSVDD